MLEAIGLILAILDFFNLTPWLEKQLDLFKEKFERSLVVFKGAIIRSDAEVDLATKAQRWFAGAVLGLFCAMPAAAVSVVFAYRAIVAYRSGEPLGLIAPDRKGFGIIPPGGMGELISALVLTPFVFATVAILAAMIVIPATT